MRWLAVLVLVILAGASHEAVGAGQCPKVLLEAQRLIVVTPDKSNEPLAIVETFVRTARAKKWLAVGGLRFAVVGLKGVAWGAGFRHLAKSGEPLKGEGDGRTPMGIYAMGPTFGFGAADFPGHIMLQTDRHVCVEEPVSANYGRILARDKVKHGFKFDQMRAQDLYRKGLVVDYPADGANKAGSCIFIHVWREPTMGSAGCVALEEIDVADLQSWVSVAPTAIAILSTEAKAHFSNCLP